jgi:hypothetical protein
MASTPPSLKILVVGSAMGSIDTLFDKMSAIHEKHGPFNLALCTGDFFGPPGVDDGGNAEKLLGGQLKGTPRLYRKVGESEPNNLQLHYLVTLCKVNTQCPK